MVVVVVMVMVVGRRKREGWTTGVFFLLLFFLFALGMDCVSTLTGAPNSAKCFPSTRVCE